MAIQSITFMLLMVVLFQISTSDRVYIECQNFENNEPCTLNCIGEDQCKGDTTLLICKSSQPCTINCNGKGACSDATIISKGATDVTLTCSGGYDACKTSTFTCGSGDCRVYCDPNYEKSCDDMQINVLTATSFICTGKCPSHIPDQFTVSPTPNPTISTTSTITSAPTTTTTITTTSPTTTTTTSTTARSTLNTDSISSTNLNTNSISSTTRNSNAVTNSIPITSRSTITSMDSTTITSRSTITSKILILAAANPVITSIVLKESDNSELNNESINISEALIILITVIVVLFCSGLFLCIFLIRKRKKKSVNYYNDGHVKNNSHMSEGGDIETQKHNSMSMIVESMNNNINMKQKLTDANTIQHNTLGDQDSSESLSEIPPPPPPPTIDVSIYAKQQKFMQEEMDGININTGSLATSVTTDASLYVMQQKYQQIFLQEMNSPILKEDMDFDDGHGTMSTDVSLYQKQHQFLQDEINEKANGMNTPGEM